MRLHLAEMLIGAGRATKAITHVAQVLGVDPEHTRAKALTSRALGTPAAAPAESSTGFNWQQAEAEVGDVVPPMFVDESAADTAEPAYDVERPDALLLVQTLRLGP